jgi:hypothetical protein
LGERRSTALHATRVLPQQANLLFCGFSSLSVFMGLAFPAALLSTGNGRRGSLDYRQTELFLDWANIPRRACIEVDK